MKENRQEFKELQIHGKKQIADTMTVYYSGVLMIPDRLDIIRYYKETFKTVSFVNFRQI